MPDSSPCVGSRTHGKQGGTRRNECLPCVLDLGTWQPFFIFNFKWFFAKKKHSTTTTLPCVKYMAHGKPYFFSSINSTNLISKHVSLNLSKCTLQSIIKLTKHITRSAYFKILYFSITNSTKKFKKWQTNSENYHDWTWTTFMWCIAHIKSLELKLILANHYAYTRNLNL